MRVDIVSRDVCFFIASVLTMQLWMNMTKEKAKDCPFAAEKCPYMVMSSINLVLVSTVISHCCSWC